jgi:glutaryl-CoA dehydrogenase
MTGKVAMRASWQADVILTNARVPVENRLALSRSFKDTARVLTEARCGIAWHAVGHAMAAYEVALSYAKERILFGKPLATSQIIQNKLAVMHANLTSMQLLYLRLAQPQADGVLRQNSGRP